MLAAGSQTVSGMPTQSAMFWVSMLAAGSQTVSPAGHCAGAALVVSRRPLAHKTLFSDLSSGLSLVAPDRQGMGRGFVQTVSKRAPYHKVITDMVITDMVITDMVITDTVITDISLI